MAVASCQSAWLSVCTRWLPPARRPQPHPPCRTWFAPVSPEILETPGRLNVPFDERGAGARAAEALRAGDDGSASSHRAARCPAAHDWPPAGDASSGRTTRMAIRLVVPGQALAACWHPPGTVLAVPQNPGAPTVDFSLTEGQHRDAGGRSSRRRRAQEASRCAS